jgi:hypothetical protein
MFSLVIGGRRRQGARSARRRVCGCHRRRAFCLRASVQAVATADAHFSCVRQFRMPLLTVCVPQLVSAHDYSCPPLNTSHSAYIKIDPVRQGDWPSNMKTTMCRFAPRCAPPLPPPPFPSGAEHSQPGGACDAVVHSKRPRPGGLLAPPRSAPLWNGSFQPALEHSVRSDALVSVANCTHCVPQTGSCPPSCPPPADTAACRRHSRRQCSAVLQPVVTLPRPVSTAGTRILDRTCRAPKFEVRRAVRDSHRLLMGLRAAAYGGCIFGYAWLILCWGCFEAGPQDLLRGSSEFVVIWQDCPRGSRCGAPSWAVLLDFPHQGTGLGGRKAFNLDFWVCA